jgi:hypothetical protein
MGILIGLRHDADLANHPLLVDLAGGAIGARPFGHWPAPNALLIGERHLVIFAVVLPGLLGPGLLDDLEGLLVDTAVVIVDRRAVHWRTGDMVLLAEHVHPAVLITPSKPGVDPPLGQVIEHGELLRDPDRIP